MPFEYLYLLVHKRILYSHTSETRQCFVRNTPCFRANNLAVGIVCISIHKQSIFLWRYTSSCALADRNHTRRGTISVQWFCYKLQLLLKIGLMPYFASEYLAIYLHACIIYINNHFKHSNKKTSLIRPTSWRVLVVAILLQTIEVKFNALYICTVIVPISENATGRWHVTINGIHLYFRSRIVLIKEPLRIQIHSRDTDITLCQTSLLLLVWLKLDGACTRLPVRNIASGSDLGEIVFYAVGWNSSLLT
jgi:hypothetical protein